MSSTSSAPVVLVTGPNGYSGTATVVEFLKQGYNHRCAAGLRPGHTYWKKDWNTATWDDAAASDYGGFVYCASKVIAERAAWDFLEREKPGFSLTVYNPPMVFGPPIQPFDSLDRLNEFVDEPWQLLSGKARVMAFTAFLIFVDVRDLAYLQVVSLANEAARDQRYFTISSDYTGDDVVRIAAAAFPAQAARMTPLSGQPAPRSTTRITFRTLEQSVVDTTKVLFDAEGAITKGAWGVKQTKTEHIQFL
ncbi:hypothetical protein CALCODRAFT_509179 [Calocera cornea HHB12733]|uniref:NAD(P)-binding protein n=1 Tax=Calocera cornea HHB12733 TaxID=1353952 RepID=A0A165FJL5_9BASI|nr:hypothetical protein CALCODRAFT_509179 [Calocera cornea HHB12733]